jgi:hypothetical protein
MGYCLAKRILETSTVTKYSILLELTEAYITYVAHM